MDEQVRPDIVPTTLRAVAVVVALEASALVVAALVLLVKIVTGRPGSVVGALLLAALALLGAAVLGGGARGLVRRRPGARTPVLILQVLALPVAYSLWFQADLVGYGAPVMLAALVTIYLLFTPAVRAALDR